MQNHPSPRFVRSSSALPQLQRITIPKDLPTFELTFISSGHTFKALAKGRNAQDASHEGLIALAYQCPDFDVEASRLIGAVQVQ